MKPPLCIDLFCGCFGWSAGWLEQGGYVVGFDLEHLPHHGPIPHGADLVIQDVLTLHGSQFRDASLILASPPCQFFSYCAMPWSRAKKLRAEVKASPERTAQATALFDSCFRIQREAIEAAGHHIPLVVENVRGACEWVGRSRWNYGSFHFWGDVPALMPQTRAIKVPGLRFDGSGKSFQTASVEGIKNEGGSWFNIGSPGQKVTNQNPVHAGMKTVGHANRRDGHSHTRHLTNQAESDGIKCGGDWFNASQPSISRLTGSKSKARKAASAAIAKIPFALASHIARYWKPVGVADSDSRGRR